MHKEVLRSIESVAIYPEISLLIFFVFFVFLLYRVIKVDERYLNDLSMMPLEKDYTDFSDSKSNHKPVAK